MPAGAGAASNVAGSWTRERIRQPAKARVNSAAIEREDEGMVERLLKTPIQNTDPGVSRHSDPRRGAEVASPAPDFSLGLAARSLRFVAGRLPNVGFSVR